MTTKYTHSSEVPRREAVESLAQKLSHRKGKGGEFQGKMKPLRLWAGVNGVAGASLAPRGGRGFRKRGARTASQRGASRPQLNLIKNFGVRRRCDSRRSLRSSSGVSALGLYNQSLSPDGARPGRVAREGFRGRDLLNLWSDRRACADNADHRSDHQRRKEQRVEA